MKVRLYLSISGAIRIVIDIMNSIGFSSYYITVNNYKRKLVDEHPLNIRKFFSEHVNKIKKKKCFFKKLLLTKI